MMHTYETEIDRQNEEDVANFLLPHLGCDRWHKHEDQRGAVDFRFYRGREHVCSVEIKCRKMKWAEYRDWRVGAGKVNALKAEAAVTGKPGYMVIACLRDGSVGIIPVDNHEPDTVTWGRKDRPDNPNHIEPSYRYLFDNIRRLG